MKQNEAFPGNLKRYLVLFLVCSFFFYLIIPSISQANPAIIRSDDFEVGGLIPGNFSHNLELVNAYVLLDIDATEYNKYFDVDFDGIYQIYNPNETVSYYIATPFTGAYEGLEETLVVLVNDEEIDCELVYLYETDLIEWNEYFWGYYFTRIFAICEITFEAETQTSISFNWEARMEKEHDLALIYYDVGTGRSWNGGVTERVQFKIHGKQPSAYTGAPKSQTETLCDKTRFWGGKIYTWHWENQIIQDNVVGVNYDYDVLKNTILAIALPSTFGVFLVMILVAVSYIYKRKKVSLK